MPSASPLPRMTCATKLTREGAMRKPQYTLTPKDVQARAAHLCHKHLRLKDHGPKMHGRHPAGPSSSTPPPASPRWPPPARPCSTPLRLPPPTTPCWPPSPRSTNCSAASTAPCRATCPTPCAAAASRWPSTCTWSPTTASPCTTRTRSTAARPRAAPATSTPTPPPTSSARASASPWP